MHPTSPLLTQSVACSYQEGLLTLVAKPWVQVYEKFGVIMGSTGNNWHFPYPLTDTPILQGPFCSPLLGS